MTQVRTATAGGLADAEDGDQRQHDDDQRDRAPDGTDPGVASAT